MTRTITTFTNRYGSWSFDTASTVPVEMDTGDVADDLPSFFRLLAKQRDVHRLLAEPYTVTQAIVPQGGDLPHAQYDPDVSPANGPEQCPEVGQ